METISYNKIKKKKKSNALVIAFSSFLLLSVGTIAYFIINEPTPRVVGSDPAKIAEENASVNLEKESKKQLTVNVATKNEKDTSAKTVVSNINFPTVTVDNVSFTKLNEEVENNIRKTFVTLKNEMSGKVNNTYEFTSVFRNFENIVGENQILSLIVTDKMTETSSKNTTYLKTTSYNVNLKTMEKINSYEVALDLYGKDYKEYVSNVVTTYLIDKKIKSSEDASYVYTGLENFYIEAGEMHILLNTTDIGTDKFGVVDIKIMKK